MNHSNFYKSIVLMLSLVTIQIAFAQSPGDLDTTFNQTGKTIIHYNVGTIPPFVEETEYGEAVFVYPDNSMLVGSNPRLSNTTTDMGVTKLDKFGNIDTSFGNNGQVTVGFDLGGDLVDLLYDIVVYSDGRILLVGSVQSSVGDYDFALARLMPNGLLDTSFDGDGKLTIWFDDGGSNEDTAISAVLVPSGVLNFPDIIVAGNAEQATGYDIAVAKIDDSGSPLILTNSRFNPGISATSHDGLLDIIKAESPINGYWLLGYADEGNSGVDGDSPYLVKIDGFGNILLSSQNFVYDFTALDNRPNISLLGVAKAINADKFAFVGRNGHGGFNPDSCIVTFVNIESLDVLNSPVWAGFDIETSAQYPDYDTQCTDAVFNQNNQLFISGNLTPENNSDTDMLIIKLSSIDVVANGLVVDASFNIDNNFGSNGISRIAFDESAGSDNTDFSEKIQLDSDNKLVMLGSAEYVGTKYRTAVARVIGDSNSNDIVFKNGFE